MLRARLRWPERTAARNANPARMLRRLAPTSSLLIGGPPDEAAGGRAADPDASDQNGEVDAHFIGRSMELIADDGRDPAMKAHMVVVAHHRS
jgi:hypothetical protein